MQPELPPHADVTINLIKNDVGLYALMGNNEMPMGTNLFNRHKRENSIRYISKVTIQAEEFDVNPELFKRKLQEACYPVLPGVVNWNFEFKANAIQHEYYYCELVFPPHPSGFRLNERQ